MHTYIHTYIYAYAYIHCILLYFFPAANTNVLQKFRNLGCARLSCTSVCLLIIILGIISFPVLAFYPPSYSKNSLAFQGDTLYLASASEFWYSGFSVAEIVQHGDYNHKLQFYTVPCEDIRIHFLQDYFQRQEHYLTYRTRILGSMDYLYLLADSNLTYSVCLWSNQTFTVPAEFLAFDSLSAYQNFIVGLTDGRDTSIMQQQLKIGSTENPACSTINFMANKSAYYFMSVDCPGGVTYQYNITSNVKYLNFTDYENFSTCTVTKEKTCQLVTDNTFFGAWKDVCLVAHVKPSLPFSTDPPTTHIKVETMRKQNILIIPAIGISILVLFLFIFCIIISCRNHRKGYKSIPLNDV